MIVRLKHAILSVSLIVFLILSVSAACHGAFNDWAEGNHEQKDGATRDYYNMGGKLPWDNYLGDWRDADGIAQGGVAFDTVTITDDNSEKTVEWNIAALVQQWLDGNFQNQGVFLHPVAGSGPFLFYSREYSDESKRPKLIITSTTGQEYALSPEADTYMESSTYQSLGTHETLRLRFASSDRINNILIRFNLDSLPPEIQIQQAYLQLTTYEQYGSSSITVGAFRCSQGESLVQEEPVPGLAGEYPEDIDITNHPDVIFATGFESDTWEDEWTSTSGFIDTVTEDESLQFESFINKAFRGRIAEGDNYGFSLIYKFMNELGYEPEEIYFRYYLRLANDWNQTLDTGKMPGISGTYGTAGWGGRPVDGTNGWSARGSYRYTIPAGNPLEGRTPLGTYCYHADMVGDYGSAWLWTKGYNAYVANNQWYCVEQYLKMNTPGQNDGIIKAWIDGRLAFEKTDIRFRDITDLKIEQIWMNVYHGGGRDSPYDQHLYFDNVVIATSYIGPIARTSYMAADHDTDGDVDGVDLAVFAQGDVPNPEQIAEEFGLF